MDEHIDEEMTFHEASMKMQNERREMAGMLFWAVTNLTLDALSDSESVDVKANILAKLDVLGYFDHPDLDELRASVAALQAGMAVLARRNKT